MILLSQAKNHLRVSDSDEDEYIEGLISAATDIIVSRLNRDVFATKEAMEQATSELRYPIVATPAIRAAILLVIGDLYANRENIVIGTISSEIPNSAYEIIRPFRMPP